MTDYERAYETTPHNVLIKNLMNPNIPKTEMEHAACREIGMLREALRTPAQTEQEPVAWRTFDGEGGYDYRSYEDNEEYAKEWEQRNPKYKGWVEPLYKNPTPCETCQALARTVMMDQTGYDPRPWVGLTDEEIRSLNNWWPSYNDKHSLMVLIRDAEAKLKEKNT